jgi:hypothetical protein
MTANGSDPRRLIERALEIKAKLRTPEQGKRREAVDARNHVIQQGVKQPASGTFGSPKKDAS